MGRTVGATAYTCDVCNIVVPENQVIAYRASVVMPGTGAGSFDGDIVYGCSPEHVLQALQTQITALEAQRVAVQPT